MNAAGFLEFQRRLLRDGEARPATEHEQALTLVERGGHRRPVEPPGGTQQAGQSREIGRNPAVVSLERAEETGSRGERGHITIRRRAAVPRSSAERQRTVGAINRASGGSGTGG